jgi:hypothetical protein
MRIGLRKYQGTRTTLHAEFGGLRDYRDAVGVMMNRKTALLVDVLDSDGELVTDHMYIRDAEKFRQMELQVGDTISVTGPIGSYFKYTPKRELDYTLTRIDEISKWPTVSDSVGTKRRNET